MDYTEAALRLIAIKGLGIRRVYNLLTVFPDIQSIFSTNLKELCKVPGISKKMASKILSEYDTDFIQGQMEIVEKSPFKMITLFDKNYPQLLKKIYDPPLILFHHGEFKKEDHDAISIVGMRNCSQRGKDITADLVKGLTEQNITIISGFARGIDTASHKAAIKYGGRTIAVLGNGIDKIYPPENRALRKEIVENGVYCSEFPFGTKPDAQNFPRRNRIISGLSLGTIVIEAGERSGSLLTAYYALDQNREVFALPGRMNDSKCIGPNKLIQKGAKLVTCVDDILQEVEKQREFPVKARQLELDFDFVGDEKIVWDALEFEPIQIDKLSEKTNKNSYELLSTLLTLELKGVVRQTSGKRFSKIG